MKREKSHMIRSGNMGRTDLKVVSLVFVIVALFSAPTRAELIAYDQFSDYTNGVLGGQAGGFGWSGNWYAGNNGGGTVPTVTNTGNLSYAAFPTAGGGGQAGSGASGDQMYFGRFLAQSITNSGTYYFGFLLQQTGSANAKHNYLRLQSSNGHFAGAGSWNSSATWQLICYQGSYLDVDRDTGISETTDVTHFVIKFVFDTSGDESVYVYVDPADAETLAINGNADTSHTFSSQWTSLQRVHGNLETVNTSGTMAFDEIRIGTAPQDMFTPIVIPPVGTVLMIR